MEADTDHLLHHEGLCRADLGLDRVVPGVLRGALGWGVRAAEGEHPVVAGADRFEKVDVDLRQRTSGISHLPQFCCDRTDHPCHHEQSALLPRQLGLRAVG